MKVYAILFVLCLALPIGNFIYQAACPSPDYGAAIERSYFQVTALILAAIAVAVADGAK